MVKQWQNPPKPSARRGEPHVEDMLQLLSAGAGRKTSSEKVQADINAGAPVGANGRMNLSQYATYKIGDGKHIDLVRYAA